MTHLPSDPSTPRGASSAPTAPPPNRLPLLVAHRTGNDLALLRQAEALAVDFVETDVWLYRGRLELRHLKTLGPLPLLWDRWYLTSGREPRLHFHHLLAAARPETPLLLDLKGFDPRLAARLLAALDRDAPERPIAVCSRNWRLLAPFAAHPRIAVIRSVGSERQRHRALRWLDRSQPAPPVTLSIHARLLTPAVVAAFAARGATLIPWAVHTAEHARELLNWGVGGINSDDLALLREVRQRGGDGP